MSQWSESAKSHGMAACPLLKRALHRRRDMGVEIIPRCIRSSPNISADGLTRRSQYECEQCMYAHGIQLFELPELWLKCETEWGKRMDTPPLNTPELLGPLAHCYQTDQFRVVEWRSRMFCSARILNGYNIPAQYLEIENKFAFAHVPESGPEYNGGGGHIPSTGRLWMPDGNG